MEKQKGILSSSIMNTPKLGIPRTMFCFSKYFERKIINRLENNTFKGDRFTFCVNSKN